MCSLKYDLLRCGYRGTYHHLSQEPIHVSPLYI